MNSHKIDNKRRLSTKRKLRIRKTVSGTTARPRLTLKLTNKNIHAQLIDDTVGKTLFAFSSVKAKAKDGKKVLPNIAGCTQLGEEFGAQAQKTGVKQVVFDRNGRRYHGTVKAFADAVRKAGVQF